ncbi:MAG: hypothetical protein KAR20_23720 [Candidatus Heimdallarchaeota archaeon]|nr:hypothetical protein [Candidatus Heimdallarchaeota archaeon]
MKQLTVDQVREFMPIVKKRVISLIGKGTPDWEDLTQDIMLSMVKAIKTFRHDSDVKTLLYIVTMRRYYEYLRRKYRERKRRILRIDLILDKCKLTNEQKNLLTSMKKTILNSSNGGKK